MGYSCRNGTLNGAPWGWICSLTETFPSQTCHNNPTHTTPDSPTFFDAAEAQAWARSIFNEHVSVWRSESRAQCQQEEQQRIQRQQQEEANRVAAENARLAAEAIESAERISQEALASNTQASTSASEAINRSTESTARVASGAVTSTAQGLQSALDTQIAIAKDSQNVFKTEYVFIGIALLVGVSLTNKNIRNKLKKLIPVK